MWVGYGEASYLLLLLHEFYGNLSNSTASSELILKKQTQKTWTARKLSDLHAYANTQATDFTHSKRLAETTMFS